MNESSGINTIVLTAMATDAAAPPNKKVGDVFNTIAAIGNNTGAVSIACATNGNILSLEASNTPKTSSSSAFTSNGTAVDNVNPAFSNRDNKPSCAVYLFINRIKEIRK